MKEDSNISQLLPSSGADIEIEKFILSQRYSGSFQLRLKRASRLPAFSRQYIRGDPAHLIDWKAFARNDQLIVREVRDEASSRVAVVVDMADTMNWPDISMGPNNVSKWEIAIRLAFHIIYAHIKKGDRARLYFWNSLNVMEFWRLNLSTTQDTLAIFHDLESHDFILDNLIEQSVKCGNDLNSYQLTYLLSDLLREEVIESVIKQRIPTRVFHVMSSKELNIDWLKKQSCYFDESRGRKEFLGNSLKDGKVYDATLKKWFSKLDIQLQTDYSDYNLITDKTSILQYLSCLLHPQLEGG